VARGKTKQPQPGEVANAPSPADFDASTPPPRTRPVGEAVRASVKLPPGESITDWFCALDRAGRIPPASVLAGFVGTGMVPGVSGYRVIAATESARSWAKAGVPIDPVKLERYDICSMIAQGYRNYVILFPLSDPPA
jgi:hypothetical protein